MRELVVSDEFLEQLDSLPAEVKKQTLEKVGILAENPKHQSLNPHKLDKYKQLEGLWECYVNKGYRVIYEPFVDHIKLWRVGPHKVVDQAHLRGFAANTQFRRLHEEPTQEEDTFVVPEEWFVPQENREPDNPFALMPSAHLRILGVPSHLVKAVQRIPYIDDLEKLEGLPKQSLKWLHELILNEKLERLVFDEGRLVFRATLDQLEGYVEGRIKRLMLNLTPDQQQYVDIKIAKPTLLRGCAGSGKTTVAVYRAIKLAETGAPVIFITFNKTLASAARTLIEELIGPLPDNLQVVHLDRWIAHFLQERSHNLDIVEKDEQAEVLKNVLNTMRLAGSNAILNLSWMFFRDEIGLVIKGNGLQLEEEYLSIPRYGRKTALSAPARRIVWQVYESYQQALNSRLDWQDLALTGYSELSQLPLETPYDHVVVDEVQDLSAMQLRVIQRLIKGGLQDRVRSIFLVGDIAQSIYSRGFTWEQAGLRLRGNSYSIRRNFRNTRQIADAAALLNSYNRMAKMSEFFVDPEYTQRHGAYPIVLSCDVSERETRAVCEKLLSLIEGQQFRLSDFAVIAPTIELCAKFQNAIEHANIPCTIYSDESFDILEERVKILTIHSAKGLEFPVVFLVGLHVDVLPRKVLTSNDEEPTLQLERERTLMYVGMTRAAEALYLVTSSQQPSPFLQEISSAVRQESFDGAKS